MAHSFDLTKLDAHSFEHMVNMLALNVIGNGLSSFGPGSDGGRDGYFEGTAPYPSLTDQWSGVWYIQSKFHGPQLSDNPQQWLLKQISDEIEQFEKHNSRRKWPDNWIVVSNIDPSGVPETGAFDRALELVQAANPALARSFHIWGGKKVIDLLFQCPAVSEYYGHFLTPGHVLKALQDALHDEYADAERILRFLLISQFEDQQHTKLEQAGSTTDNRPGIHYLFTDLPFLVSGSEVRGMGAEYLAITLANNHKMPKQILDVPHWREWQKQPKRARIWFIKGGPGQGKSTLTQYICQVQRAALILQINGPVATEQQLDLANQIKTSAISRSIWPLIPRIPILIELRDFAQWFGGRKESEQKGFLTYLAVKLSSELEQTVLAGTLLRMFSASRWLCIFDGLDEVPGDIKDDVSKEVIKFANDTLVGCRSDFVIVCTSRPQGYSGQLSALDACVVELAKLTPDQALSCAEPVLKIDRGPEESLIYYKILKDALQSTAVQEIMTTPLQAHIMAVVVRDGSKPPERKWQLYTKFYAVIKQREANRRLLEPAVARLLGEDTLLKAIHNRLGFELHKRAETKQGASTHLTRDEFLQISKETVIELQEDQVEETVSALMEATTNRLVLVNTPENGSQVKFDIRPLQEFFCAEYIYDRVDTTKFDERVRTIAGDSHWREVMHFLLSALIENGRQAELAVAVQALTEINGTNSDNRGRLVDRRTAIGSLISSRLLEEGVLDQDKRFRNQFSECIEPLLASAEFPQALINIRGLHTTRWLITLLVRQVIEKAPSESLSAAALLVSLLPDANDQVVTVINFLKLSTASYRAGLYILLDSHSSEEDNQPPYWVARYLIEEKLSERWLDVGQGGSRALDSLISEIEVDTVAKILSEIGLPNSVLNVCCHLLRDDPIYYRPRNIEPCSKFDLFGICTIRGYNANPLLNPSNFTPEMWHALSQSSGYLQLCYKILKLSNEPSDSTLDELKRSIGSNSQVLNLLHDDVFSWLPHEFYESLNCKQDWRARWALLSNTGVGICNILEVDNRKPSTSSQWHLLLRNMPSLALNLLFDHGFTISPDQKSRQILAKRANQMALLAGLQDNADHGTNIDCYGILVTKIYPNNATLRAQLCACFKHLEAENYYGREIIPYKLSLPLEANLLPHIINRISDGICFGKGFRSVRQPDPESLLSAEDYVAEYIGDCSQLVGISSEETYCRAVRGAAATLLILHPKVTAQELEAAAVSLPEFYDDEDAWWFVPAAGIALKKLVLARQDYAMAAMAQIWDLCRDNFHVRVRSQPIIDIFREASTAPLSRNFISTIWKN